VHSPQRTLVLIDPSSPDGENGIDVIGADEPTVTLLLLLDHVSAAPVEQFADAERISLQNAAEIYLQQVADRVQGRHVVDLVSTVGHDYVGEILHAARRSRATRIVVPWTMPGLGANAVAHLADLSDVPVRFAPPLAALSRRGS